MDRFRKIFQHNALVLCIASSLAAAIIIGISLPSRQAGTEPIPKAAPAEIISASHRGATLASLSSGSGSASETDSGMTHLLLIGQDRRDGETRARSDSIVLCSFHLEQDKITATSFLRDLYVQIPGHRGNRINAAYALGGMDLMEDTFAENFGIPIEGCIEVDFSQFSQLVDLRGGVAIRLRQDEAELLNRTVDGASLSAGLQTLNGQEALAYARIRNLDADGDFSRTDRQRKIITAFFDQCRDLRLPERIALLDAALPMINTNLKRTRILKLAAQLLPRISEMEIVSQRIPADGDYTNETIDGMSVLVADMEATRRYLAQTLSE